MACVSGETKPRRPGPSMGPLVLGVAAFFATAPALAEDGPDASYMRLRTVAISVRYHDGQQWTSAPKGLGSGFLIHPDGFVLTARHLAPDEYINDVEQRDNKVEIHGQVGGRSSPKMHLKIIAVHPDRDAMLLKFARGPDSEALKFFDLTNSFTLPIVQVSAAGFPADPAEGGTLKVVTEFMRSPLGEGDLLGEVNARLPGGFSGGPVLRSREVVGLVETSSTEGQRETFNFVPIRLLRSWLSDHVKLDRSPLHQLKEDTYEGKVFTKQFGGVPGIFTVRIDIESFDDKGNVKAEMKVINGLPDAVKLVGTVDEKGKLILKGSFSPPGAKEAGLNVSLNCVLRAKVEGDVIKGKYNVEGSGIDSDAEFESKRQGD